MLPSPLRWRWAAIVPLNLVAAGAEAAGAVLVFGFLSVVARQDAARDLPGIATLIPLLGASNEQQLIVRLGLGLLVFYLVRSLVLSAIAYVHEGVVQESIVAVSDRLFWGYLHAPYAFHLDRNSASLIQRLQVSVDTAYQLVLSAAAHLAGEGLIALGLVIVLATVSPLMTLSAVGLTTALLLISNRFVRRFFVRSGERQAQLEESFLSGLQQSLGALKEVRLMGRERFFHAWVVGQRTEMGHVLHRHAALTASLRLLVETAFFAVMLVVIIILIVQFGPGANVISILGLFAYATFRLVPTANRINLYVNQGRSGQAFVNQLYDDCQRFSDLPPGGDDTPPLPLPYRDAIVLDSVSFAYPERARHAVQDVSVTITRGESVGIVGHTGAGKSTLASLLLGLLEPAAGRICVDTVDIQTERRRWQAQIGYIPQELFLIDDSVRHNIAFGIPDSAIDDARMQRATRLANLDDFVSTLPNGLATIVGERGVRLSGGERQRVAIARALYRDPQVLIFDEGMAALDPGTEAEIVAAIDTLHGDRTLVVIAHRLSTVQRCDRIIVMQDGRVTAVAPYGELLATHQPFQQIAGHATREDAP